MSPVRRQNPRLPNLFMPLVLALSASSYGCKGRSTGTEAQQLTDAAATQQPSNLPPLGSGDFTTVDGGGAGGDTQDGGQSANSTHPPQAEQVCNACDDACEAPVPVLSAAHVQTPLDYPDKPPAGGDHNPCWGLYQVYPEDSPLAPERWVHNLEHGAVVYLYNCPSGCSESVQALTALVDELPRTLLTPYTDMPEGFAAVAWGHRLLASCLDLNAMRDFYEAHFDMGLESVDSPPPDICL